MSGKIKSKKIRQKQQPKKKEDNSPERIPSLHPHAKWHCLFLFLLGSLLYANTLDHGHALDDSLFVHGNEFVRQGVEGLGHIWTTDAFVGAHGQAFDLTGGRYRPFAISTFAVEYELFGDNTFTGHFFNTILYALTGILLYLFLLRLLPAENSWIPLIASTIFIIHPIHTEVVANIKSRDELFVLFFLLLSLTFLLKEKLWQKTASLAFFLLALLSKENAITFMAVIPLTFYFFRDLDIKSSIRKSLPYLGIAVFYLVLRTIFAGSFGDKVATNVMDSPYLYADFAEKYATILYVCGKYLWMLFFPYPLSYDYSFNAISYVNWGNWKVILSLLAYVGMIYYAIRNFQKRSVIVYGIIIYLASFSIVSNVFFNIGAPMGERFIYLPSLGFCIALAAIAAQLLKIDLKSRLSYQPKWLIPLLLIVPIASYATVERNKAWENNFTLYETDIKTVPTSARAQLFYGIELLNKFNKHKEQHYIDASISHLKKSVTINPEFYHAWYNLGLAYQAIQDHENAIASFERVLEIQPRHINSHYYLGMSVAQHKKDYDRAIQLMEKAISVGFKGEDKFINLGITYAMSGNFSKAIETFHQGIAENPNNPQLYVNLAITYRNMKNPQEANKYFQKAVQLDPSLKGKF